MTGKNICEILSDIREEIEFRIDVMCGEDESEDVQHDY
jgi:hypothetical protein